MKKSSLFAIALSFGIVGAVSCGGKEGEKATEDSIRRADSIAQVKAAEEKALAAAEQARLDSLRQDSIEKREKAIEKIPSFSQINGANMESVLKKAGFKIKKKTGEEPWGGDYYTYIASATYNPVNGVSCTYKALDLGYSFTIVGADDKLDKFYQDAKNYIASEKRKHSDDWWYTQWSAKKSGNTVTVLTPAD